MPFTREQLVDLFTYHVPSEDQVEHYQAIRTAALEFVSVISEHTPGSADQTYAIRMVRAATLWANSAIALGGKF